VLWPRIRTISEFQRDKHTRIIVCKVPPYVHKVRLTLLAMSAATSIVASFLVTDSEATLSLG
jgi:hypothetical protein